MSIVNVYLNEFILRKVCFPIGHLILEFFLLKAKLHLEIPFCKAIQQNHKPNTLGFPPVIFVGSCLKKYLNVSPTIFRHCDIFPLPYEGF